MFTGPVVVWFHWLTHFALCSQGLWSFGFTNWYTLWLQDLLWSFGFTNGYTLHFGYKTSCGRMALLIDTLYIVFTGPVVVWFHWLTHFALCLQNVRRTPGRLVSLIDTLCILSTEPVVVCLHWLTHFVLCSQDLWTPFHVCWREQRAASYVFFCFNWHHTLLTQWKS